MDKVLELIEPTPERTLLPNGLRIVTESMPHVRSVSIGVWVDRGSRHESAEENGLSHFTEHMVFKGAGGRSAEEIACSIDAIGGYLDAFTTKESVAFTAKVLDEHLPRALDIVSDLVLHPAFPEGDVEKEKGVVLEELKMDEDNPDYLLNEIFTSSFWPGHAIGRSIIGTPDSIKSFNRGGLQSFFDRTFHAGNFIITAAGRLDHNAFVRLVEERFGGLDERRSPAQEPAPSPAPAIVMHDKPSLEQIHLSLGMGAHAMADPRRFTGYVLSAMLGGGFSSRLFLKIREREGLAYAVFSDLSLYSDTGCMSVYAGTSLEAAPHVIRLTLNELRDLRDNLAPDEELRRAKEHLKGSLMLSLESTASRMSNLARQEKYFERSLSLDEVLEHIEAVSAAQVRDLAADLFQQDRLALTVLGDLQSWKVERDDLAL